ncbi:MAG: DUF3048 domain-containing protein, partial [Gallionella sp.]|nr:DUF3048 domain-containing protein [Gallionella sp.]
YLVVAKPVVWPYLLIFFLLGVVFSWWVGINISMAVRDYSLSWWADDGAGVQIAAASESEGTVVDGNTAARLLDGLVVDKGVASYWPYGVMIENLREVRPQSGLSQASVVYETLAEGGSTRFLAIFDPHEIITEIMPVRSARPYYIEWVSEFGALYAHAGGSPKALTVIWENPDINNLEALSNDGKYFWRDRTKFAPHNLVTSSEKINFALRDKALSEKSASFRSWLFKDEASLTERGTDGKTVSFNFSSGLTYKTDFLYRQSDNIYLRSNANSPHLDKNTGQQISVKNVIVQLVEEPGFDNTGKGRLDIYVGGTGKAWIFRDGQVIEGTWQKNSRTDRTIFYDSKGQEVELNRGNTWVHVLPKDKEVAYQ